MAVTAREKEWASKVGIFIKIELKRRGIGYRELSDRLKAHGMPETEDSITSKLSRGTFSATFFLATLSVLGIKKIDLDEL